MFALLFMALQTVAQEPDFHENGEGIAYFQISGDLCRTVLENNKALLAAKEQYRVVSLEASTGITPPDPQVELGYLFGKPVEMGNRIDLSVTQEIDFPTTYIHRTRARDLEIAQAKLTMELVRQKVLLQAIKLWVERVYLNQLELVLGRRVEQTDQLVSHYRQKLSVGEVGQLAYSQSNLQSTALKGELEKVRADIRANQAALEEVTGGTPVEIRDTILPASGPIERDSIINAYGNGPLMQYFRQDVELKEQRKNLAASLSLPKIKAGYYSESVITEQFRGFQVGISLPLWEHSNRVKLARSEVLFAEAEADHAAAIQRKELIQKIERWESLGHLIQDMEDALSMVNDIELLHIAWKGGEISLAEYMVGSDLYFRNLQSLLTYKRDQLIVEAELRSINF